MSKRFLLFTVPLLALLLACGPKENPTGKGDDEKPELKVNKEQINAPSQGSEETFTITSNCYWDITVSDPDGKAVAWIAVSAASGQGSKDIALSVSANKKTEARTALIKINVPSSADIGKTITVLQEAGEMTVVEGYGFPIIETFEIDSPESRKLTNAVIGGNVSSTEEWSFPAAMQKAAWNSYVLRIPSHRQVTMPTGAFTAASVWTALPRANP